MRYDDASNGGAVRRLLGACMLGLLVGCLGGDELAAGRLPASTAVLPVPEPEARIVVGPSGIYLDGDRVIRLERVGGRAVVPAGELRGRLVTELHRRLLDRSREARSVAAGSTTRPFRGAVSIEMDRDLPGPLLVQVVVTAAAADFAKPWLVVDGGGDRRGIPLTVPTAEVAEALDSEPARPSRPAVTVGYANPQIRVDAERGFVVVARDKVVDPSGQGQALSCDPAPCTAGWPTVELNRLARRIKLDHPRDRAVVVTAGESSTVQALVGAFDATRHDALAGRGNRELFPEVILGLGDE
jgi:hypothetical protein